MSTRSGPPTFGLAPDKQQMALLKRYFGVSRYAYNWVLYANREERLAGAELRTRFDEAVAKEAPWVREVPVAITDAAIRQAERDLVFLKGKGRRPRYRRKEDDASVRIDADAEGFRIGQGGVQLPEVGKLSLVGGNSRIGGSVEAVVIVLSGDAWSVQFLLARGERKNRDDGRPQRDRDLPAWQRRDSGDRIDSLPESVQLVREGDDGSTIVIVGSGTPAPVEPEPGPEASAEDTTAAAAPPEQGESEAVAEVLAAAEEAAADEPVAVAEEPVAEEPSAEEPAAEEPSTEEPAAEEPSTEEPSAEEPVTELPVAEEPVAQAPQEPDAIDIMDEEAGAGATPVVAAARAALPDPEPVAVDAAAPARTGWEALERWVR